jgi:hypothetical protein
MAAAVLALAAVRPHPATPDAAMQAAPNSLTRCKPHWACLALRPSTTVAQGAGTAVVTEAAVAVAVDLGAVTAADLAVVDGAAVGNVSPACLIWRNDEVGGFAFSYATSFSQPVPLK